MTDAKNKIAALKRQMTMLVEEQLNVADHQLALNFPVINEDCVALMCERNYLLAGEHRRAQGRTSYLKHRSVKHRSVAPRQSISCWTKNRQNSSQKGKKDPIEAMKARIRWGDHTRELVRLR